MLEALTELEPLPLQLQEREFTLADAHVSCLKHHVSISGSKTRGIL
jgi:hypothetical protein